MINIFILKKYAAFVLAGAISTVLFSVGLMYYGLIIGVVFYLVGLGLSILLGNALLRNPFSLLLEGKGVLILDLNSTGIIRPYIASIKQPYIKANIDGQEITDTFNRETVQNLIAPRKPSEVGEEWSIQEDTETGTINITLTDKGFNKARMGFLHYPTLIYNSALGSLLTKDMLADMEKTSFAEHHVIYLNRRMEDLTRAVRDFGRHFVELFKPAFDIFKSGWTWIIIVIFGIILLLLFGQPILQSMGILGGSSSNAIQSVADSVITPK